MLQKIQAPSQYNPSELHALDPDKHHQVGQDKLELIQAV
jgi:hypothetical protein